ncbi:hypothetical protein CB0940_00284 [Cercospora beticola]|uniref:Heterokaryon incompatibility domain-containing protein n=1 Tax=Cercospora beticola TaxID=122368 RepID=A0A2G5I6V5_CERBT|nr:hypothetical protein CB0940_00284 [Cercospora beticola]PIB00566.1 hypothetical protein CB0940_00284 [Cercospora beticola]WPA95693.1 hypothetical protein RHO25_000296 [Cercospora beticola]
MLRQQEYRRVFQYEELQSPNTFRLLRLCAGSGERIQCSLDHFMLDIDPNPLYTAISHTWGTGAASHQIYLRDGSVIKVRENLYKALQSIRDPESDNLYWVDAICINQKSDQERNHQVKLMADIYGKANKVLVWLQSSGEKADVSRAFAYMHAAATYHNSDDSVYQYLRGHQQRTDDDWRSIQRLCKLKYWTRKWIIQELVMARTVVLRAGNAEFPMTDFETFCYQLRRANMNEQFRRLNTPAKKIWQTVNASPASRLALQRLEAQLSNQPRTLYELVENNRDNQCQVHCDHVYALYSLAGEHRSYLNIDYGASPVQRLVDILDFVTNHEDMPPAKVMAFTNLLINLLKINNDDFTQGYPLLQTLWLTIPAIILGTAELRQESHEILKARKTIKPFEQMPIYTFSTDQATWTSIDNNQNHRHMSVAVGRRDMAHFSIAGTNFQGLAACTVNHGDIIWNFSGTKHVFIVRTFQGSQASIVGRAYLFQASNNNGTLHSWISRNANQGDVSQGTQLLFGYAGDAVGDYEFGEYDESAGEEEEGG